MSASATNATDRFVYPEPKKGSRIIIHKRRPFIDYCAMYVVVLVWSFFMTGLILPEVSHGLYGTTTDVPTAQHLRENMSMGYFGILILYYVSASIQLVTVVAIYALIGFAVPIAIAVCIARRKIYS